jgi:hypothetical protein
MEIKPNVRPSTRKEGNKKITNDLHTLPILNVDEDSFSNSTRVLGMEDIFQRKINAKNEELLWKKGN